MSYNITFHFEADKEYRESFLWYEKKLKGLGDRFEKAVDEKISILSKYPGRFPRRKGSYREVLIDNFPYVIVYRFNKKQAKVFISSIYHTSRNPNKKYRR